MLKRLLALLAGFAMVLGAQTTGGSGGGTGSPAAPPAKKTSKKKSSHKPADGPTSSPDKKSGSTGSNPKEK
jgi:hypothetical protein